MTEQRHDEAEPAVDESLDRWAAPAPGEWSEAGAGGEPPTVVAPSDESGTATASSGEPATATASSGEPATAIVSSGEPATAIVSSGEPATIVASAEETSSEVHVAGPPASDAEPFRPVTPVSPPVGEPAPFVSTGDERPFGSTRAAGAGKLAAEHPELVIGAAFIGGFLLAAILKRLAR